MRRRQFLALTGVGITGTAGCISGTERETTDSPTTAPAETDPQTTSPSKTEPPTTSEPEYDADIAFSGLQSGVVEFQVDAYELTSDPDSQYLFLDVTATSEPRAAVDDFEFRFDGETHPPKTDWGHVPLHRSEEWAGNYPEQTGAERYRSGDDADGWIVFALPERGDASEAALTWSGGEWTPDESVRARLADPLPELSVDTWTVPETLSPDANPEFEITVRNEGSHPGQFWGAINGNAFTTDSMVTLLSRELPPGGTETWQVTGRSLDVLPEDEVDEGREVSIGYTLLWEGENRSASTSVTYE